MPNTRVICFVIVSLSCLLVTIPGQARASEKPNVLLLIVDDLNTWMLDNPNRFGGKVIAPNIRRLAASGVNFTRAYAASPKCSPSRTALFSGVAPWKSGVTDNGVDIAGATALHGKVTLPTLFKENGYYIASFGKISHGFGDRNIWDVHVSHKRDPVPPGAMLNGNPRRSENDWGPTHLDESQMNDTKYADLAIEQLQRKHDKPFLIACGVFHPHAPWYVPQKYLDMYPVDKVVAPPVKEDDADDIPEPGRKLIKGTYRWAVEAGQYKHALQGYLASSTYADAQMGRVLDALDKSPYGDNTIVVLMSDHGFHVGEKTHWQKGTLWEEGTNSLLMFRVPGMTKPDQTCKRTVSLLDIYPTLVQLVGLPKPDHLDGVSLVPQLEDVKAARERPAVSAYQDHLSVRTETHRYIRYGDRSEELYDHSTDPNEWTNIAAVNANRKLKKKLAAHLPSPDEVATPRPRKQRKGK